VTVVQLREAGPAVTVALDAEQARRLAAAEVIDVRPGASAGLWTVRADRKIGAARVGDIELRIEPKVPIARLLFLLGYARDPKVWRDDTLGLSAAAGLVPALATALWRQTDRALRAGLAPGLPHHRRDLDRAARPAAGDRPDRPAARHDAAVGDSA
jgi:5-methylcytosine-specific restriction enzyme subunit McrC